MKSLLTFSIHLQYMNSSAKVWAEYGVWSVTKFQRCNKLINAAMDLGNKKSVAIENM
jgi:hypothetical protein